MKMTGIVLFIRCIVFAAGVPIGHDRVRRETQQLRGGGMYPTAVARTPLDINLNISVDSPTEFLESLPEPCSPELSFPIVLRVKHQHANPPHAPRLLRARRERPRNHRATNKSDEFPSRNNNHSITSSASASNVSGRVRPSALAVFMLRKRLNRVGRKTGIVAGLAPPRIWPV